MEGCVWMRDRLSPGTPWEQLCRWGCTGYGQPPQFRTSLFIQHSCSLASGSRVLHGLSWGRCQNSPLPCCRREEKEGDLVFVCMDRDVRRVSLVGLRDGLSEKAMESRRDCPRISLGCLCTSVRLPRQWVELGT